MSLIPFLFNKAVLISLSLIVVGSATIYGGIKANDYRDTQIILQEAKQLSSNGKYQESETKLLEADGKWTTSGIKKEVENLKEENKTLLQSTSEYKLGKELFDKGKYADALEVLKKVDFRHANYFDTKSLIELAEKKLETPKGQVAGIATQTEVKVKTNIPIETPISSPTLIPSPTPQPTPLIDPGKTAEIRNIIGDINRQVSIIIQTKDTIQFYQNNVSSCLNHVSETINNAPIIGGSKLNYSPSQIQTMKDACNNSSINNLTITSNAATEKLQVDKDRLNILAAECPQCWEEAKK